MDGDRPIQTASTAAHWCGSGLFFHPWLGVQLLGLTPERTAAFRKAGVDITAEQGMLVVEVVADGPADKAGIHGGDQIQRIGNVEIPLGGDIITALNNQSITDMQQLTVYLETHTQVGDTIDAKILRNGEERTIRITLEERPAQ